MAAGFRDLFGLTLPWHSATGVVVTLFERAELEWELGDGRLHYDDDGRGRLHYEAGGGKIHCEVN